MKFLAYLAAGLAFIPELGLEAATYQVAQQNSKANDDAAGTAQQPWKTITKAAQKVGSGDIVVIHGGVYREEVLIKNNGTAQAPIRFEAAPGERVLVTGADRITDWRKADDTRPIYGVAWPYRFIGWNRSMTHPDDEYHSIIGRCEQVVAEGYLLHQATAAAQMGPGTFFPDVDHQKLLVWDAGSRDLNDVYIEASVRQQVLRVDGDYVQVRGLRFRYAANMAQHGAILLAGSHDTLEDCIVEEMNASGAGFVGPDAVVRRCVFRDNGQLGFGGTHAHRLLFTECLVENNNTKAFSRGWEAGGDKLVLSRDAVIEKSRFLRNRGSGIWFDIGNENCTVRQCLIADNEDAGIFDEISYGMHAHDNVIVGNGFAETPGAWGAQAGICVSSSPNSVIERNIIVENREGFDFREQDRTTQTIDGGAERSVWNHDELIGHNMIGLNRDAQVWGWFDNRDGRQWPASSKLTKPASVTISGAGNIAAQEIAKDSTGQPHGLTLETLGLHFEKNIYFAATGERWFEWGPTWRRHKSYPGLTDFRSDLGIDAGSQAFDPGFADLLSRDFRLSAAAMASAKENYPQGPVPGVALGVGP